MRTQDLLREITKEKEMLERKLEDQTNQRELDFLTNYRNNNRIEKFTDLKKIDMVDMAIAYCISANPKLSLKEVQNAFRKLEPFMEIKSPDQFMYIFNDIQEIYRNNELSKIEEALYEKNILIKAFKTAIILANAKIDGKKDLYISLLMNEESILLPYFKLLEKDKETVEQATLFIATVIGGRGIIRKGPTPGEVWTGRKKFRIEDLPADMKSMLINIEYGPEPLNNELTVIDQRIRVLKSEIKEQKKKARKELEAYERLERELKKEPTGIIRTQHQLTAQIQNEEIKKKVLQFIYEQNEGYYQEIERTYQQLTENSVTKYQALLQEYGISKDRYQDKDVMKNSLQETKEMLEVLTSLGIEDKTEIVNILKTSSKAYLDKIVSTINEGYFSKEFAKQIPSILIEEQDFYSVFKGNKESIEEKKINPMMLSKDEKTWLTSPEQLKTNLAILEEYQLLGSMSKTEQYSFLGKETLEATIDTILELGLEPMLDQSLDLLNYDDKKWMRIRVLKELNMIPSEKNNLIEVLEKPSFFVPEERIEEYIFEGTPRTPRETTQEEMNEEDIRKQLSSFQQTKRTYNIDGVILSKNKVDRNLRNVVQEPISTRDKIYLSLVDNTILQEQELQQIEKAIQSPVKKLT